MMHWRRAEVFADVQNMQPRAAAAYSLSVPTRSIIGDLGHRGYKELFRKEGPQMGDGEGQSLGTGLEEGLGWLRCTGHRQLREYLLALIGGNYPMKRRMAAGNITTKAAQS